MERRQRTIAWPTNVKMKKDGESSIKVANKGISGKLIKLKISKLYLGNFTDWKTTMQQDNTTKNFAVVMKKLCWMLTPRNAFTRTNKIPTLW